MLSQTKYMCRSSVQYTTLLKVNSLYTESSQGLHTNRSHPHNAPHKRVCNMSTYIDTHTHLDKIMHRMRKPDAYYPTLCKEVHLDTPMEACIHVSCEPSSFKHGLKLVETHPNIYGAFGVRPKNAKQYNNSVAKRMHSILLPSSRENTCFTRSLDSDIPVKKPLSDLRVNNRTEIDGTSLVELHHLEHHPIQSPTRKYRAIALGECGLDYSQRDRWGSEDSVRQEIELQKRVFIDQIQLAVKLKVPLVIHTREAETDTLDILNEYLPSAHPTHVHCFTSHKSLAVALLKSHSRLYIGFTGAVTFKSAHALRDSVREVPLDRILLETDGPYMAPEPHRGTTCVPAMIPHIAECIAKVKEVEVARVYEQARKNTHNVYGI